jgi:hypothetical protein
VKSFDLFVARMGEGQGQILTEGYYDLFIFPSSIKMPTAIELPHAIRVEEKDISKGWHTFERKDPQRAQAECQAR